MEIKRNIRILLIEDEEYDIRRIKNTIKPHEEYISIRDVVASGRAALALLKTERKEYDVVIMDFQIAGNINGENLIKEIKSVDPTLQIIVVTKMTINVSDFNFARRLLEAGAMWYCTKYPGDIENYIYQPTDFILSIYNAFEKRRIERAKIRSDERLKQTLDAQLAQKPIIGESKVIKELKETIGRLAQADGHVLITGNSGTGKELVATHIHAASERRYEKFVPINCGSLPGELIESELFGFERGSFTGAHANKQGLFEIANRGTIFLDEISELPKQAQVKLLRVIQEGELDKIGRTGKVKVNVRIIAATNKNLLEEVKEKRFREDLYYRLNVLTVYIPELNQRRSDIPLLVSHFLKLYSQEMGKEKPELPADLMNILVSYDWRGNVRQLQNVLQRLLMFGNKQFTEKEIITALDLPIRESQFADNPYHHLFYKEEKVKSWREMESILKAEYFQFVRNNSKSDAETARKLGLAPPNFHRMSKELGLK
ncbi:MAG: sigma-54-dependent Fis family transcriptional regulator [Calditrichales bacterium]|nr:MAG: sigma-54-dependent Fis family transcriptional regulator [Calditrichales bacterium]